MFIFSGVRQVAPVGRNLTYHVFHNLLICWPIKCKFLGYLIKWIAFGDGLFPIRAQRNDSYRYLHLLFHTLKIILGFQGEVLTFSNPLEVLRPAGQVLIDRLAAFHGLQRSGQGLKRLSLIGVSGAYF